MVIRTFRTMDMWTYFRTFLIYLLFYSSSEFTSACPPNCKCANMKVDCSNRDLPEVPDFKEIPMDTTYLDLRDNLIERINAEDFRHIHMVQTLILRFNKIKEIENGAFSNMPSLKNLDLSGNYLKNLTRNIFKDLHSLHSMDLSQNYLENLDGAFANLSNLYRLDLAHNNLETLSNGMFTDMKGLMYLMISHNLISKIGHVAFYPLVKLSYLVLKNNPLHNVNNVFVQNTRMSYADFSSCKLQKIPQGLPWVLRYLQLTQNNITSVEKRELTKYYYVGVIVLDQNQITTIENGTFSHMRYLRELWFNGNRLTTIPHQLPLGLRSLYLDNNDITQLHDNIFNNRTKLVTFSVKGNHLSEINSKHFNKFTELKNLYIDNNNLTRIDDFTFKSLGKLQTLYLSRNPLREISRYSFYGLRQLQNLHLAFIITEVHVNEMAFGKMPILTKLELHYSSKLAQTLCASPVILESMTNLTELNLMSTDMTALTPDIKLSLPNLQKLKLSDNRWHCDRSLLWLNHWMRQAKTLFVDKMDIKCFSPFNLRDKVISSMFDSQFVPTTTTVMTTTISMFMTSLSTVDHHQTDMNAEGTNSKSTPSSLSSAQTAHVVATRWTTRAVSKYNTNSKPPLHTSPKPTFKPTKSQNTHVHKTIKVHHSSDRMAPENPPTSSSATAVTAKRARKPKYPRTKKPLDGKNTDQNSVHKTPESNEPGKKHRRRTTTKSSSKTVITFNVTRVTNAKPDDTTFGRTAIYQVNNTLMTTTPIFDPSSEQPMMENSEETLPLTQVDDSKITAIATSISVVVLALILAAVGYLAFRYRRNRVIYHRTLHCKQGEDVMCFVTVTESETTKAIKESGRSERGSVSSVTSEDITSEDGGMKVYHWEDKIQ